MKILFVSLGGKDRSIDQNRYEILCRAIKQDRKHTARVALIDLDETIKESGDPYLCEEDVIIVHSSIIYSHYQDDPKMESNWENGDCRSLPTCVVRRNAATRMV